MVCARTAVQCDDDRAGSKAWRYLPADREGRDTGLANARRPCQRRIGNVTRQVWIVAGVVRDDVLSLSLLEAMGAECLVSSHPFEGSRSCANQCGVPKGQAVDGPEGDQALHNSSRGRISRLKAGGIDWIGSNS